MRDTKPAFFLVLLLVILACSSAATPPAGNIEVSQAAADRLKDNFYQSIQEATLTRESQLRVTNEEITSLVVTELTETGQLPVSNPQIWFTAGQMYLSGQVRAFGVLNLDSFIVATVFVENGQMRMEVTEAQMGPFDFPATLLESITDTMNETLADITTASNIELTRVEILEGEMFVVGRRR